MRTWLFVVSVGLNLALAALLWRSGHPVSPGLVNRPVEAASRPDPVAASAVAMTNAPPVLVRTHPPSWSQLQSEDLHQYLRNLRAAGCPERAMRNILSGAVHRRYAVQSLLLPRGTGFWSCGLEREVAEQNAARRRRALEQQRRELLAELLETESAGPSSKSRHDLIEQAICGFVIGPVPPGVSRRVMDQLRDGDSRIDEYRNQTDGLLLAEDKATLAKLRQENRDAVRALLTPEQFDEFAARNAAFQLRDHELKDFQVNGQELRQIAHIAVEVFGPVRGLLFEQLSADTDDDSLNETFSSRLKAFLGETRFAQWQRETDPTFRTLRQFAEEQKVPAETALRVYEIQDLLRRERERLQANTALELSERETQWSQIQETTCTEVARLLGRDAFLSYLNQGHGQWLTNREAP